MDMQSLLNSLIPLLGNAGVEALKEKLDDLSANQDAAWKATVLALLSDAVEENGPQGIALAQQAVEDLLNHKVPDIDWASPRTASDLVAQLQNAEADKASAVRDWFVKLGDVMALIGVGIVKGLMG